MVDLCSVCCNSGYNKGLETHGCFDRPQEFSTLFFGPVAGKRDVKHLHHHIEWMPERTGVRICPMYVSCHMNIRKMKSKPELRDDMLNVLDEAGPDELDTEGDVTLESWTGFSQNPTCLLMVTLLKALQWQTRLRHWRCSSSLTWISGAATLKKLSQLSILRGSLM